jgi:hypothetical protein
MLSVGQDLADAGYGDNTEAQKANRALGGKSCNTELHLEVEILKLTKCNRQEWIHDTDQGHVHHGHQGADCRRGRQPWS